MNHIILIAAALILIVLAGYKKWINITPVAIAVALFVGIINGFPIRNTLELLPVSTMYDIFILTFFFGYAMDNGTFTILVNHVVYRIRNHAWLVMPLLYLLSFTIAFLGPGVMSVAFVAPFAYQLASKLQSSDLLAYASTVLGCIFGSNFPHSVGGSVIFRLIQSSSVENCALEVCLQGFLLTGIVTTATFIGLYLICRGWRVHPIEDLVREPLDLVQKQTLILIAAIFGLSTVPHILRQFSSLLAVFPYMELFDVPFTMALGCCLASALHLGDDKRVLTKYVPWQVIALIGAMGMLIGTAKELGLTEALCAALSQTVPAAFLAPLLALIGGLMSIFTSAIGVVIPTLYTLVPELSLTYQISPVPLFTAVFVAATITGSSPLSTTGGMALSGCQDAVKRETLLYRTISFPFILLSIVIALVYLLA